MLAISSLIFQISHVLVRVSLLLPNDVPSFLCRNCGDLNLAHDILLHLLQLLVLDLLRHHLGRIRHVSICSFERILQLVGFNSLGDVNLCLTDGLNCFLLVDLLDLHFGGNDVLLSDSILELLLQSVQGLNSLTSVQLQSQQLLVFLVDLFNMLLVLDLQLMEINKLKVITHFVFVFDCSFGL